MLKNSHFINYFAQEDRDTIEYRGTSQDYFMIKDGDYN